MNNKLIFILNFKHSNQSIKQSINFAQFHKQYVLRQNSCVSLSGVSVTNYTKAYKLFRHLYWDNPEAKHI